MTVRTEEPEPTAPPIAATTTRDASARRVATNDPAMTTAAPMLDQEEADPIHEDSACTTRTTQHREPGMRIRTRTVPSHEDDTKM